MIRKLQILLGLLIASLLAGSLAAAEEVSNGHSIPRKANSIYAHGVNRPFSHATIGIDSRRRQD